MFQSAFTDVPYLQIIMDDFLIAAETLEEHKLLIDALQTATENNIICIYTILNIYIFIQYQIFIYLYSRHRETYRNGTYVGNYINY